MGELRLGQRQFDRPLGIATDAAGDVYVADRDNARIQKFTTSGADFVTKWGRRGAGDGEFGLFGPRGLATGAGGNVYAVEGYENNRVQKFTPSGTFITKWGGDGSGDGQFNNPFGIDNDDGGDNERIQKFTSNGEFLSKIGSGGQGVGQLNQPKDLTVDRGGTVLVADTGNDRMAMFNNVTGASTWGSSGSGDGEFRGPSGVVTDDQQNVYVADTGNNRIQKFGPFGDEFMTKWGGSGSDNGEFNRPTGIAIDNAGHVYVADTGNNRIQEFTASGDFIAKWGRSGSADGQFDRPQDVAVDASGRVYVADTGNHRIQVFAPRVGAQPRVAAVQALEGTVRTKCRDDGRFMRLKGARQISLGCVVDARSGKARLISPRGAGPVTRLGKFRRGVFRLSRLEKHHHTGLKLAGRLGCHGAEPGRHDRKLRGRTKGRFRIEGRHGAADVHHATWRVADRCNGSTVFKALKGKVRVRDFEKKKTVTLRKGERYVAAQKRR